MLLFFLISVVVFSYQIVVFKICYLFFSAQTNPPPPLLFVGLSTAGKPSPLPSGLTGYAQAVSPPLSMNSSLPLSTASTSATHSAMDGVKKESEPLTYLVRPQSKVGRVDMTSGGVMLERADAGSVTKVFHNIFMLTDVSWIH